MGSFFQYESELLQVQSEAVFSIGEIAVTNSMMSALLVTFLVILLCIWASTSLKKAAVPGKFQLVVETLVMTAMGFVDNITGDSRVTRKIFPLIGGLLIYLLLANTFLVIPGLSSLQYDGKQIFRPTTTDFNATFGIATAMLIFVHLFTIMEGSLLGFIGKYIRVGEVVKGFRQGIGPGIMSIIDLFIGLLDIISEFAKSLSLSLRLFGNIFAGELLSSVMMGIFAIFLPIPFLVLSLFSGVVQAIVFGALTSSYFGIALKEE
ncbi:MAG: ATP synthase subunit a [candidate division WS6 bacterium OLB20]|uniref:ATP synthase subunit a n=1 Tax=candidate division WS6 bacterium OLB20 TaxID=1617426 RepID=A0A136M0Z6_9BACT|nr:MAG: ATP synthase subunit a [candidate division WS6 bacterium OLB20]